MAEDKGLILIADDNSTMRLMVRKSLEDAGFVVVEAQNGVEAVKRFSEVHPDAVLLDVEMPEMDGITACSELRKLPESIHIPIMMVTSRDDGELINRAFQSGATEFTVKPINWEILGYRVHNLIKNSRDFLQLVKSQAEVKKVHSEIEKINADLEHRVTERTEQLQKASNELQTTLDALRTAQKHLIESEKTSMLGNLIEGIAHEALSPIDASMRCVTLLKQGSEQVSEAVLQSALKRGELIDYLSLSTKCTHELEVNLLRTTELIKNFRQLSVEKNTEIFQNIQLKEYLQEVLLGLRPVLKKTQATVNVICPDDLVINSYPGILFRIIMALVTNSILHGFETNEAGRILLAAKTENDKVVLSYSDSGKGIAGQNLSRIFEPFFSTKSETGSIGLGLYLVYSQVTKILSGDITCESKEGEGVRFTITLPRS